jgi:signal transduction histidine kinase
MTIFWHKDAGGNVTEAASLSQMRELSHLYNTSEGRNTGLFGAATQRRAALIRPLFRLERELATAASIQEAVNALLRAADSMLEPALCTLVFVSAVEGNEEGYFFARFEGQTTLRRFSTDVVKMPRLAKGGHAAWQACVRSLWTSAHRVAEHLDRDAVYLPLEMEERNVGALLLWPDGRQDWPATDLQAAYLALSLASSAIHRLMLQGAIDALQRELLQRRAEAAQAQQRARRSERLAVVGQVISSVAHELNNPLTSVIGHAEFLRNAKVPDAARKSLQIIDAEAQQCRHIVQNLLGLVRPQCVSSSPVALDDLIQRTIDLYVHTLEEDGIDVVLDLEPLIPPVLADAHHLQQVLVNLVNNAREAIVQSGQGGTLRIATHLIQWAGRTMGQVRVDDDGPGVPEGIRECIFEPFFTTKRGQGTGLGLAISRQLVLDMGGELSLDASASRGAHFVIRLPIAAPERPGADSEMKSPQGESAATQHGCGTALIVEDDENLADLVERALEGACHSAVRATNGEEALEQIAQHDFDLILLDLRMPQSDGRCTYESLRSRYPYLLSRLVFATGDMANAETRQWLASTGRPVLEKPFDLGQLRDIARQVLRPEV